MLLIGVISLGITSCDKNDDDDVNPSGNEVASAKIVAIESWGPEGSIIYMGIYDGEVPSEIDIKDAIEIGANGSVYSLGENPYTWNANAGTITKWAVDKQTLEPSPIGILSLASTGFSGTATDPVFVSETRAFSTNLNEGLIVEWDPSTMEITKVHDVPVNPYLSIPHSLIEEWAKYVRDSKIIIPIYFGESQECCTFHNTGGEMVAVFDLNSNTLEYIQDPRNQANEGAFAVDENQNMYSYPGYDAMWSTAYKGSTEDHFTVLKVNSDGNYDPNFELNLKDILPIEFLFNATTVFDNKMVLEYVDDSFTWPSAWDDRWSVYDHPSKRVSIDLTTKEVKDFTALDGYTWIGVRGEIDGVKYFRGYLPADQGDGVALFRQNSFEDYTKITTMNNGDIRYISKLW